MECHVEILLWFSVQVFMCAGVQQSADYHLCPGEQTTLMCSTNHIFLEWNISSFRQTETRSISNLDPNPTYASITMNSADFTFSRESSPEALPLETTMTIMNVNSNLEGTVISCSGLNSSSVSSVVLMTTLHVYQLDVDIPNAPEVSLRTDMTHFGTNNSFTVTLAWYQFSDETYSVASAPEPVHTNFISNTSVQYVMLYNTQYNVTVTTMKCGHRNATKLTIHHSECGYPTPRDEMVTTFGHTEGPWLEGNTISYSCPSGLKIAGTNTSTCMDNGQWEPHPSDITCTAICGPPTPPLNGHIYSYSNKSLRVIVVCHDDGNSVNSEERLYISDCHLNGTWQPNPSDFCGRHGSDNESQSSPEIKQTTDCYLLTTIIISSVSSSAFFFIIGTICGQITWLIRKKKKNPKPLSARSSSSNSPDPLYEVVPPINLLKNDNKQTPKEVNIQFNEAYSTPIKILA